MPDTLRPKDIKVSVIVPFLNAQDYIERSATSILSQTLKEMEVIFVNDGSFDRGAEVLDLVLQKFPERADNVIVIHLPIRHGLHHANHEAMVKASGKYLIRCDADDEFNDPGALQRLVDAAERDDADIAVAPYVKVNGEKETVIKTSPNFPDINRIRIHTENYSLWNKLISRKFCFDNDIFPLAGVDCWEDLIMVSRLLALNPGIAIIDTPVYRYYTNPNVRTLSRASRDTQLRQHLRAALMLEEWFANRYPDNRYEPFLNRLKLIAKVKFLKGKGKDVDQWKKTFPEVNDRIMSITEVPLIYRLMFAAVAALPTRLTQWIANQCDRFYKD